MSPPAPVKHPANLPEPVIVKDCRPQTLPSSSDRNMQHFLDFGGGVNPMAYKGYTFSKQGRFQFWQSHNTAVSPTAQSQKPTKPKTSRESTPHVQLRKELNERPAPPPQHYSTPPENQSHLCCPLMGPVAPLFCKASLKDIAISFLLSDNLYLSWRVMLLFFFVTAIGITASENLDFIATLPGFALLYSFFSSSVMVTRVVQYRIVQLDNKNVNELTKSHGLVVIIYQGGSHVCFLAGIGSFLNVLYGGANAASTAASYFRSASVYLLITAVLLHLIDVCFTPIPFRLFNTVPLYIVIFLLFLISLKGGTIKQILIGSAIMVGSSLGINILVHLFARSILFAVHKKTMVIRGPVGQVADPWADVL